uniref:T-complex protein 1 subunit alpha n=1 Tax=Spumella elongata TaxID=89044 RepID=A0A7S3GN34_9STRA
MASGGMLLDGERTSGQDVRTQNVTAAMAVANIVKTSLGPVGLDKMLVDEIGDVTITNDGATILAQLDIEHPAAKVLVELAQLQDQEVGDGTTSVVIVAAELLKRANELVKTGIHPTVVMAGYRLAAKEAVKYIKSNLVVDAALLGRENLVNAAKTSMSSKIIGSESAFFSNLAVTAALTVKIEKDGKSKCPIGNIHILKSHGKSALDSELVDGFALNCARASPAMPTALHGNVKVALLDFNLQKHKMQMGVQVVLTDTKQVEEIRQREMDITKEKIQKILASGAKVILTTKGIDDLCLKYFVEAGAMAVRRVKKEDLKRIAKATGGQVVVTMADLEGNEAFDASNLGECSTVCEERVGDGELLYFRGCKNGQACTVVLRGANEFMLDEMDRALHDSLCVIKRMIESNSLVAGGGAVEVALSIYLDALATSMSSREQLAVAQFAEALLIIPRTLTINAAHDATELLAKLKAHHHTSQFVAGKENMRFTGLDLSEGVVRDNLAAGVVEPAISKIKSLRFATEAAVSILRIDDMIKLNPAREQKGHQGHGH